MSRRLKTTPELFSPHDMVSSGLCIGCGMCVAQARENGASMAWDDYGQLQPAGSPGWLRRRSAEFSRLCPFSPMAPDEDELARMLFPSAPHADEFIGRYAAAYVGYVREGDFRRNGSSGGLVSWTAAELLRTGLVDGIVHVVASDADEFGMGHFRYGVSYSEAAARRGAKSRYYPVELSAAVKTISEHPGRYAVVGIPCFIKALHLLCAQDERLRARVAFTLGLFCGHMKSARFVESLAWQMGRRPEDVRRVEYRKKDPGQPANWYVAELTFGDESTMRVNWWDLVDGDWGAGYFQAGACNFCDDIVGETADISFGDAWLEPYASDGRGTNVVVVRSAALRHLLEHAIEDGRLHLETVDNDFVKRTQAAGIRQRREGLAYRLALRRRGIRPGKRVAADASSLHIRRKVIYLMRGLISRWSHRVFWLARALDRPAIYLSWARGSLAFYHALAYSRGRLGRFLARLRGQEGDTGKDA
ncbi:MAG: Coenzyme F420 hydrogenase/dehydrogenase, beta subunit C-terminal domain [Pseudomonadota bacterium]